MSICCEKKKIKILSLSSQPNPVHAV